MSRDSPTLGREREQLEKKYKKGTRIFPFSNVFVFKRLDAYTNTFITFYV